MNTTGPYQVCGECGAEYPTAAELLAAHNRLLAAFDWPECTDARKVLSCPSCTHDFLYPPTATAADDLVEIDDQAVAGDLPRHAARIAERLRHNGFDPDQAVTRQVLGLAEETGEFVGAYRRWSGQARRSGTAEEMGVDINTVIAAKLRKIYTRGWRETTAPQGGRV